MGGVDTQPSLRIRAPLRTWERWALGLAPVAGLAVGVVFAAVYGTGPPAPTGHLERDPLPVTAIATPPPTPDPTTRAAPVARSAPVIIAPPAQPRGTREPDTTPLPPPRSAAPTTAPSGSTTVRPPDGGSSAVDPPPEGPEGCTPVPEDDQCGGSPAPASDGPSLPFPLTVRVG